MDGPIRLLIILAAAEDEAADISELRLTRLASPYYLFRDLSADVVLASPAGGAPPMADGPAGAPDDDGAKRFIADRLARDDLADTLRLDQIVVDDFDAAFCIGFSGSIWEADNLGVAPVIGSFLSDGKPVAVIPGQRLEVTPKGAAAGLLIVGDSAQSPLLAAHALMDIVTERRREMALRSA